MEAKIKSTRKNRGCNPSTMGVYIEHKKKRKEKKEKHTHRTT